MQSRQKRRHNHTILTLKTKPIKLARKAISGPRTTRKVFSLCLTVWAVGNVVKNTLIASLLLAVLSAVQAVKVAITTREFNNAVGDGERKAVTRPRRYQNWAHLIQKLIFSVIRGVEKPHILQPVSTDAASLAFDES